MKVFYVSSTKNELHITHLISNLLGAIQFLNNFAVSPNDSGLNTLTGIRSLSQRVRLNFQYIPDDPQNFSDLSNEFFTRHNFFTSTNHFNIIIEQFNTFDSVKSLLLRVRSKDDFLYFQEAFHHNIDFRRDHNPPGYFRRQGLENIREDPMIIDNLGLENDLDE